MKKTDLVYLQDIIQAIQQVDEFLSEMTFDDFNHDTRTQFAVFYALEVVGEAANKLSTEFKNKYTQVPVKEAVELRNILIHGYDQIKLDIIWKTIEEHLPSLKDQLETIKPELK